MKNELIKKNIDDGLMKRRSEISIIIEILEDVINCPKTTSQLMKNHSLNYQKISILLNNMLIIGNIEKISPNSTDNRINSEYTISLNGIKALEILKKAEKLIK